MILAIVGGWMAFLWLLVRVGIFKKWHTWMKVSPVVIGVTVFLMIFVPLKWQAPLGPATVTVSSVEIKPAVGGQVTDIFVKSWEPIAAGTPLFEIEKTRFQAEVQRAEARLNLAREELERKEQLLSRNTVSQAEVDAVRADYSIAEADLVAAQFDLENTTVRAPFDGVVPAVTLLLGNEVAAGSPVLAFLNINQPVVSLVIPQNQIRFVRKGQRAEVTFRANPGKVFGATVAQIYLSSPHAEYVLDGQSPDAPEMRDTAYIIALELDQDDVFLPPGASGKGMIITEKGVKSHVLQQITLRVGAWLNFL